MYGMFAPSSSHQDRGDGDHCQMDDGELLVARRRAAIVLRRVDATFDAVAVTIHGTVDVSLRLLVRLAWDDGVHASQLGITKGCGAAVALVADQVPLVTDGLSPPRALEGSQIEQRP